MENFSKPDMTASEKLKLINHSSRLVTLHGKLYLSDSDLIRDEIPQIDKIMQQEGWLPEVDICETCEGKGYISSQTREDGMTQTSNHTCMGCNSDGFILLGSENQNPFSDFSVS